MSTHAKVPLRDLVTPVSRPESPVPGKVYRQIGVKLWGGGAYERESIDGEETRYAQLFMAATDDIIVNKIWARNGSVAVVPASLEGCYGSGEFPMFSLNPTKVHPRWMHWLTRTRRFWTQCDEKSRGTSGKNRIKPERFLEIEIPLPPLREQQRIVARIEALAEQLHEARGLRQTAIQETESIWKNSLRSAFAAIKDREVPLEDVCSAVIDNLHSNPRYSDSGIPCLRSPDVGWGTLNLETALRTDEIEYRRRTVRGEPQADDIVLVREGGGTGKAAMVASGQRFSLGQRVMMLRPDKQRVLPKFFLYQILSPSIQDDHIAPLSKGSASPHLNIGSLKRFPFRLPSSAEQCRIVTELDLLQAEVDVLKRLQVETTEEIDALLPSVLSKAFAGEL